MDFKISLTLFFKLPRQFPELEEISDFPDLWLSSKCSENWTLFVQWKFEIQFKKRGIADVVRCSWRFKY